MGCFPLLAVPTPQIINVELLGRDLLGDVTEDSQHVASHSVPGIYNWREVPYSSGKWKKGDAQTERTGGWEPCREELSVLTGWSFTPGARIPVGGGDVANSGHRPQGLCCPSGLFSWAVEALGDLPVCHIGISVSAVGFSLTSAPCSLCLVSEGLILVWTWGLGIAL